MIIQTINESLFIRQFEAQGRVGENTNFSYTACRALYHYLDNLSEDTRESINLDIIALCCDWSEDNLKDVLDNYSLVSLGDLQNHTTVISLDRYNILYINY